MQMNPALIRCINYKMPSLRIIRPIWLKTRPWMTLLWNYHFHFRTKQNLFQLLLWNLLTINHPSITTIKLNLRSWSTFYWPVRFVHFRPYWLLFKNLSIKSIQKNFFLSIPKWKILNYSGPLDTSSSQF